MAVAHCIDGFYGECLLKMLPENDRNCVLRFLAERIHQAGIHEVLDVLLDTAHFHDALLVAQVRQLQGGAILEPGAGREEDESEYDDHDDVILPTATLVRP